MNINLFSEFTATFNIMFVSFKNIDMTWSYMFSHTQANFGKMSMKNDE